MGVPTDERPVRLFVVTLTAVYDHGCLGVFTDLEAAISHAKHVFMQSDGHHEIRIDALMLDEPPDLVHFYLGDRKWLMAQTKPFWDHKKEQALHPRIELGRGITEEADG